MPFATGTARGASELLVAIDTLVTANGWTRLRGNVDLDVASPKAARYWRLLWWENEDTNNDYRELNAIEVRATPGGAALSGTWSTKGHVSGDPPGYFRSGDIDDLIYYVQVDLGTPQIVREMMVQCQTDNESPRDFAIQWSNDGILWTTMMEQTGLSWVDNETKVFTFDDGYVYPFHLSTNQPTRSGGNADVGASYSATNGYRHRSNDYWIYEAPGYDSDRRAYIHLLGSTIIETDTCILQISLAPAHDPAIIDWGAQEGQYTGGIYHIFNTAEINYWIYMNGHRLIVVTKSGTDDYTSSYMGFLAAFADPDNYPSPLFASATSYDAQNYNVTNNRLSSMADPGDNAAVVRLWDNGWYYVENRKSSTANNLYKEFPPMWVWPYHAGGTDRGSWPYVWVGDYVDFDNHWLNQIVPTRQDDYAMFPCIVQDNVWGNIGVMDGVYCVPGGSLVPEQQLTIDSINYRVFPNRDRRDGCNWFVVRED